MALAPILSATLLESLRCPLTMQRLRPAPESLVAFLEKERVAGRLCDQSGTPVREIIEGGLLREDGLAFYPVRNGIPVMLECIPVPVVV